MADETAAAPPKLKKARKGKAKATPEQLAEQQATRSWTSWKLDVQRAILADKRIVAPSNRLLLIYLLHQMRQDKKLAIVYDTKIMDEVVGFAVDTTIWRARTRLRELGWLHYIPGRGLEASRYWVLDQNVQGVFSVLDHLAEERATAQDRRKEARKVGKETLHSQHQAMKAERRNRKSGSPHLATHSDVVDAGLSPSLTPSGSGKGATGTSQDVALPVLAETPQAEVMSCPDCGTVAEAGAEAGSRCAECEDEALSLESDVRELPRAVPPPPDDDDWLDDLPQANSAPSEFRVSNSVRCNCGEPAICEIRLICGGPFEPHCVECAEESLAIDVRPIPANRIADRAPNSSGAPITAKDSVADYRRVRDG